MQDYSFDECDKFFTHSYTLISERIAECSTKKWHKIENYKVN